MPLRRAAGPRRERRRRHNLLDLIALAICAVIAGCDDWVEVAAYGRKKLAWLKTFLPLPNGIPSHDTFGRVFRLLDPAAFQRCFLRWRSSCCRPETATARGPKSA